MGKMKEWEKEEEAVRRNLNTDPTKNSTKKTQNESQI